MEEVKTRFYEALYAGDVGSVVRIIGQVGSGIILTNSDEPLKIAINRDDSQLIDTLLSWGAEAEPCLRHALRHNNMATIKALLNDAGMWYEGSSDNILKIASDEDHYEAVKYIIQTRKRIGKHRISNPVLYDCFIRSVDAGRINSVRALLDFSKLYVGYMCEQALGISGSKKMYEMSKLLIEKGADIDELELAGGFREAAQWLRSEILDEGLCGGNE